MRRVFGSALVAVLAVTGLTACMSDDQGAQRQAALVSVSGSGGQPWQRSGSFNITDGQAGGGESFAVPTGKLLVIEHVSGLVRLPTGQDPFQAYISTRAGGVDAWHRLSRLSSTTYNNAAGDRFLFSQEMTAYAGPNNNMGINVQRFPYTTGAGVVEYVLSGYLVDAP